jgi:hypothetical protein
VEIKRPFDFRFGSRADHGGRAARFPVHLEKATFPIITQIVSYGPHATIVYVHDHVTAAGG